MTALERIRAYTDEISPTNNIVAPSTHAGRARVRLAGIIESAVQLEILDISKRTVRVRLHIGDEPAKTFDLRRGENLVVDLHVKSETVGALADLEREP